MLSLLFVVSALQSCQAMKGHKKKVKAVEQSMTVASVRRESPNETFLTVTFNESQRFYKLPDNADPKYAPLLRESEKNSKPVIVKRSDERSDVILSVTKPKKK